MPQTGPKFWHPIDEFEIEPVLEQIPGLVGRKESRWVPVQDRMRLLAGVIKDTHYERPRVERHAERVPFGVREKLRIVKEASTVKVRKVAYRALIGYIASHLKTLRQAKARLGMKEGRVWKKKSVLLRYKFCAYHQEGQEGGMTQ